MGGSRTEALILVRDVTELRRRERELMTKDATIREIHHRVKNNLQTVAALLRLQARRLRGPEARAALEDALAAFGSIAIVHETLLHAPDEIVAFDEVADRVVMMASEVAGTEIRVTPKLTGTFGPLPAYIAMPLALVLTQLLQNALQHGFAYPEPVAGETQRSTGSVEVSAVRGPHRLTVVVVDDGVALPDDFDPESSSSLGLQIVRTLVVGELGGKLEITPRAEGERRRSSTCRWRRTTPPGPSAANSPGASAGGAAPGSRRELQTRAGAARCAGGQPDMVCACARRGASGCAASGPAVRPRSCRPTRRRCGQSRLPSAGTSPSPDNDDKHASLRRSGEAQGRCSRSGRTAQDLRSRQAALWRQSMRSLLRGATAARRLFWPPCVRLSSL